MIKTKKLRSLPFMGSKYAFRLMNSLSSVDVILIKKWK